MVPATDSRAIRIGLFDSGVGGLTVLRQLQKISQRLALPLQFYYVADTARCPYGSRPAQEIGSFVRQIMGWLETQHVDHVVMACNTSAAVAYLHAKRLATVPLHDLIGPTAKYAATRYRRIGVMATAGTVQHQAFSSRIKSYSSNAEVVEVACPKLVPLVESGHLNGEEIKSALKQYAAMLGNVESVILGCTHFPFLAEPLQGLMGSSVQLIDPAALLFEQMEAELVQTDNGRERTQSTNPAWLEHCNFYVTGEASRFAAAADLCLGLPDGTLSAAGKVQNLDLSELLNIEQFLDASDAQQSIHLISNVVPLSKSHPGDSKAVMP